MKRFIPQAILYIATTFSLLFILQNVAIAQYHRWVPSDDWSYVYIQRLQNRGYLEDLNPTQIPYTEKEVWNALKKLSIEELNQNEREWVQELQDRFQNTVNAESSDDFRYGVELQGGIQAGNTDSLLAMRDLDDQLFVYPQGTLTGYMEKGNFIAQFGLHHDFFYDQDPIGIDATRRLYIRSEDAYVGFENEYLKIYAGRFQNHWASPNRSSVILSDNAHSFDQLNITFGNDRLSIQALLGQLDNINMDNEFTGEAPEAGSRLRYLAAHRVDWRVKPYFRLTFFESVLYSGESSSLSLKYLNPTQAFIFTDNAPQNDEVNILIGGGVWLQMNNRITFQSQFMLDDIDVEGDRERTTFSWFSSLDIAELFSGVDLGIETEAVAYQTYNPEQAEGRYLYLKRGLATQFNDYIFGSVFTNWYKGDLRISPRFSLLYQGEQEINQELVKRNPDGSLIDIILTGEPEKRFRGSIEILYRPVYSITLILDVGYTSASDVNHISGVTNSGISGTVNLNWKIFDFN